MNIYNYKNPDTGESIELIHIADFAYALNRSVTSTRRLVEKGNSIRKMKALRDKSRLMIPVAEMKGYPFVASGPGKDKRIFHYKEIKAEGATNAVVYKKVLCEKCTYGEGCEDRKIADGIRCPKGDD